MPAVTLPFLSRFNAASLIALTTALLVTSLPAKALDLLTTEVLAEQDSPQEQFNLGWIYETGSEGVTQDYKKAFQWYQKAAVNGNADAQFNLGVMYHEGRGVAKNITKAM